MSRLLPFGVRTRCVRILPVLFLGGLCFTLTACGGGGSPHKAPAAATRGDSAAEPAHHDPDKANQEGYSTIVENPFQSVAVSPLSTFSADVNTASYSNVRRFLNDGHMPPRDAVFLAELVNYFPYRYPNPAGDKPVSMTLDLAPCPWKPEHHLARIGVRGGEVVVADYLGCQVGPEMKWVVDAGSPGG